MLVLARKYGERILIGDDIVVTAVEVRSGVVRIGIDAAKEMPIVRTELLPPGHKYYGPSPAPGAKK